MSISSKFRVMAMAVLLMAAAIISGCDNNSSTTGTGSTTNTPVAATTAKTPTAAVSNTGDTAAPTPTTASGGTTSSDGAPKVASLDSIKSFHLSLDSNSGGTEAKIEGDIVRPDKAKMTVETSGQKISYVVIGDDTYLSMDGTNYTKSTGGKAIVDGYTSILTSSTAGISGYNGMKNVGSESIGGEDCDHYSYEGSTAGAAGKVDLWVAKSDSTVRQWKSSGNTGGMTSDVTFTITNVNKVGDITAPLGRT